MRFLGFLLTVLVAPSAARADGPIVVSAEVGVTMQVDHHDIVAQHGYYRSSKKGPAYNIDIAYRIIDELAAGIHTGVRRYAWATGGGNIPGAYENFSGIDTAVELGVGAQASMKRFWVAPWLGFEAVGNGVDERKLAYGLAGGVDIYIHPSGHRIAAYLDVTGTRSYEEFELDRNDLYVSAGIAYRYW
jgi:hypothetical protein